MAAAETSDYRRMIREVLEESYDSLWQLFYILPADRYKEAAAFVGISTDLYQKVNDALWKPSTPRTVYYELYHHLEKWYLNEYDDGGQLHLQFGDIPDYKSFHKFQWNQLITEIIARLSRQGHTARLLLQMYVDYDTSEGIAAREELMNYLRAEYPLGRKRTD